MDWVIGLQVVAAIVLGAAIGFEREIGAQPAGLRTHMLVSLGATLFTLAGTEVAHTDPTRVAAQVVTGIGFLGGGAIFKEGVSVRGLTTAASLWVTAAIGLAIGLREWTAGITVTLAALGVLYLVKLAEREWLPRRHALSVTLTAQPDVPMDELERAVLATLPSSRVQSVNYHDAEQTLVFSTRARGGISLPELAETLRRLPGVAGVAVSG